MESATRKCPHLTEFKREEIFDGDRANQKVKIIILNRPLRQFRRIVRAVD